MAETTGLTPGQAGYASLWMQGITGLISAFGGIGVTKHNNSIAQAQANIARINAQQMELNAQFALKQGESQILKKTMAAGQAKATQRASLAANGVAVGEGSAAEIQASTDLIKEMDVKTIKENATRTAWGYRTQATNYRGQALQYEASKQSVGLNFTTSLLGSASQVANNYMLMNANGVFKDDTGSNNSTSEFKGIGSLAYGKQARPKWGVGLNGLLGFN